MAYLSWLIRILVLTALAIIVLILLNYCSMYFVNDEGSVKSSCQYDQQQQRYIAYEHYKIENGKKVALPLHEAECLNP